MTKCAHLHCVRAGPHGQGGGYDAGAQAQASSQAAGLQRFGGQAGQSSHGCRGRAAVSR